MSSKQKWELRRQQRRAQARDILTIRGDHPPDSTAEQLTRAFASLLDQGITPSLTHVPPGRGIAADLPDRRHYWTVTGRLGHGVPLVQRLTFTATRASVAESAWCTFRAYNFSVTRTGTLTVEVLL